jgi:hypothetical protein
MKIKLVQTGGLLPVKKEASLEVPWSDDDFQNLISKIKETNVKDSPARDAIGYILEANGKETSIDIKKIPKQHLPIFNDLKKNLTIIKF